MDEPFGADRDYKAMQQVSHYLDPNSRRATAATSRAMINVLGNLNRDTVSEFGDMPTRAQGAKGYWGRQITDAEAKQLLTELYTRTPVHPGGSTRFSPMLVRKSHRTGVYISYVFLFFPNRPMAENLIVKHFRWDPVRRVIFFTDPAGVIDHMAGYSAADQQEGWDRPGSYGIQERPPRAVETLDMMDVLLHPTSINSIVPFVPRGPRGRTTKEWNASMANVRSARYPREKIRHNF